MNDLLRSTLAIAVPLRILEIKSRGGPTDTDFERAKAFGPVLAEKGDVLMFGGKKKGEAAHLFNELAYAMAVMSFVPGGLNFFEDHYESKRRKKPPPPPQRKR